jgi:hypothetical protein
VNIWLIALLLLIAAVFFGLGFVVKWLFIIAIIAAILFVISALTARARA